MISFKTKLCAITFFIISCSLIHAQEYTFSGVFLESKVPTQYWNYLTWDSFIDKNKSLRKQGYQLIDFEAQQIGKGKSGRFWGIWKKNNVMTRIKSIGGWENFKKLCMDQHKDGFKLDDVESIINKNGNRIYIGLFSKGEKRQSYYKFRSMDDLKKQTKKYEDTNGPTLLDVDQFKTNDGKNQYLAIYDDKGQRKRKTKLITANRAKEFNEKRTALRSAGWQLFDYEEFDYNTKTYYMGVFQQLRKPHSLWRNLNWHSLKAHRSHMSRHRGMSLVDIELKKGKGKTSAPPSFISKLKDTPDIWQHMPVIKIDRENGIQEIYDRGGNKKKVFDSDSFCGPTSVSNGLMYWAKNGYPKLDPYRSQVEMVKTLGNKDHMNSYDATNLKEMVNGVRKYIKDHGYKMNHVYMYHIAKPNKRSSLDAMKDVTLKAELGKINLKTTWKSVINPKSTVILLWGSFEKDKNGLLKRSGGHYVTVVGYGQDKNGKLDENILIVHDPATSNENPKQRYLKVRPIVGVDNLRASTRIYRKNDEGETKWTDSCKDKQLVLTKTKDGVKKYYVLEGILDFRI